MSGFSSPVPSGMSAPLTTDNPNNHGGLIVIITSMNIVLIIVSLAARVYASLQRRIVQQDDILFGVLVVVAIIQAAVVLTQVHFGWGIRIEPGDVVDDRMLKAGYTADILSILVLGFSKVSTCLFYEGLFSQTQLRLSRSILLGVIIWMIMSVVLLAVRCTHDPWADISATQCGSLFPRWQAITAIDIVTEFCLFLYSGLAVQKVKISKRKRFMVFIALESRILLIPLAAVRLHYLQAQINSTTPILTGAFATVATEIYLAISVLCLISAFLKSFIAAFEDRNGISYTDGSSGLHSKSRNETSTTPTQRIQSRHSAMAGHHPGCEREKDPITGSAVATGGLQIYKTVQLDVSDQPIELTEAGRART